MKFYKLVGRKPVLIRFDEVSWDIKHRQLCFTRIQDIEVSTVFLCLDHNLHRYGPPVLFETMVFAPTDSALDHHMQRYCHYSEAVAGHNAMVEEIKLAVVISDDVARDIVGKLQKT